MPLGGNEPTDSLTWDAIEILDVQNGLLVAVGSDGSSDVLFSIRAGSEDDVEYGEYDRRHFCAGLWQHLFMHQFVTD